MARGTGAGRRRGRGRAVWRALGTLGTLGAVLAAGGSWAAAAGGGGGGALDALEAALEAQRGALSALSASIEAQQEAVAALRAERLSGEGGGETAPPRRGLSVEDSEPAAWRPPADTGRGARRHGNYQGAPASWDDYLRPMSVIRVPGGAGRVVILPQADKQGLGRCVLRSPRSPARSGSRPGPLRHPAPPPTEREPSFG